MKARICLPREINILDRSPQNSHSLSQTVGLGGGSGSGGDDRYACVYESRDGNLPANKESPSHMNYNYTP